MNLYNKHFHGLPFWDGREALYASILIRNDFKSTSLPNGNQMVTFDDRSKLIFTSDNVQVSLF